VYRSSDVEGLGRVELNGHAGQFQEGDHATVALRPEGFTLHHHRPASATGIVQGALQSRQYLGGRQMLNVRIDGRSAPVAVLQQSARGKDADQIANGNPIWLTWQQDAVVVLEKD
jgi:ABC-type Fe3+/spermidine/putrescine transport system ATPase subunit